MGMASAAIPRSANPEPFVAMTTDDSRSATPFAASAIRPAFLRRASVLVIVFNLLFVTLIVLTAWNNRLAADDFTELAKYNEFGLLGAIRWFWHNWTGRWAGLLIICATAGLVQRHGSLFLYTLFTFAATAAALWFLAQALLWRRSSLRLTPLAGLNTGIFLAALLFFATRNVGEVWFWLAGSACYLWPLVMLFIGIALLVPERPRVGAVVGASVVFGLIPGFNDSLALLVLPALALLLVAPISTPAARISRPDFAGKWRRIVTHKAFWPLVVCALSWLVTLAAPGNQARAETMGGLHWGRAVFMTAKLVVRGGGYLLLLHGHWLLLATVAGWVLGTVLPLRGVRRDRRRTLQTVRNLALFVAGATLLTVFPPALAYGHAVDRVYIHMTVALVGASLALGYTLARSRLASAVPLRVQTSMTLTGLLLGLVLCTRALLVEVPEARNYARAWDARYRLLREQRQAAMPASAPRERILEPLPRPGTLHTAEITQNKDHWRNQTLRQALHLPFDVRIEKPPAIPFP